MPVSRIRARAPGKLFLSGEYAVLQGAPALACAVGRHVEASFLSGDAVEKAEAARWRQAAGDILRRHDLDPGPARAALEIDSRALHSDGGIKLGFGSSAAVAVAVTGLLLQCGATINETNTVRKHISQVKGGQLARLASPARLVSLVLSDVIGDPLDIIASGPTVPDASTYSDCMSILKSYGLEDELPDSVLSHLNAGVKGTEPETPDPGDRVFDRTHTVLIANNRQALESARTEASKRGYSPLVLSSSIDGEPREIARVYAAMAREIERHGDPVRSPACVISGGETTVTLKGDGKGGRNQEFVLAAVSGIEGLERTVVFSAGTDGTDGPTDAAGAVADGRTMARAAEKGLDADASLDNNDAYHFFEPLGDLVITGPTHTNVMDLRLLLVG